MSEIKDYLDGYSDGASDAGKGLYLPDVHATRQYADGYAAGQADAR
jgi:hypothetical protein